jgi:hypothetical protein
MNCVFAVPSRYFVAPGTAALKSWKGAFSQGSLKHPFHDETISLLLFCLGSEIEAGLFELELELEAESSLI